MLFQTSLATGIDGYYYVLQINTLISEGQLYFPTRTPIVLLEFKLLDNGARTDIKMPDGTTALFYGIKSRNPKVTKLIVERSSATTINAKQTGGDTALIRAIKLDNLNVIDAILSGNPALEEKDNYGQTALMTASRKGNTRAVIRLLRKGTNPNTRDNRGITALTKAHVGNHRAVKQVLRRAGGRR